MFTIKKQFLRFLVPGKAVAICFRLLLFGLFAGSVKSLRNTAAKLPTPSARRKPFSPIQLAFAMQPETYRHRSTSVFYPRSAS